MLIPCFSSNCRPLILASIRGSCLQHLFPVVFACWCLCISLVPSPCTNWAYSVQSYPFSSTYLFIQLRLHHGLLKKILWSLFSIIIYLIAQIFPVSTTGSIFWWLLCFSKHAPPPPPILKLVLIFWNHKMFSYFPCSSPRSILFCKESWFLSLESGV